MNRSHKILIGVGLLAGLSLLYFRKISVGAGTSNTVSPRTEKIPPSDPAFYKMGKKNYGTPGRKAKVTVARINPYQEISSNGQIFTIIHDPKSNKRNPYFVGGNYFPSLRKARLWVRSH